MKQPERASTWLDAKGSTVLRRATEGINPGMPFYLGFADLHSPDQSYSPGNRSPAALAQQRRQLVWAVSSGHPLDASHCHSLSYSLAQSDSPGLFKEIQAPCRKVFLAWRKRYPFEPGQNPWKMDVLLNAGSGTQTKPDDAGCAWYLSSWSFFQKL